MYSSISIVLALLVASFGSAAAKGQQKSCTIKASGSNATDDAPEILKAFRKCGRNGKVIFEPTTYYVNSIMNVSWLENVDVDLYGTLLVYLSPSDA
jgi:hypothetical protein